MAWLLLLLLLAGAAMFVLYVVVMVGDALGWFRVFLPGVAPCPPDCGQPDPGCVGPAC